MACFKRISLLITTCLSLIQVVHSSVSVSSVADLQNAISDGGDITITSGTYDFNDQITIAKDVSITADSTGTVIFDVADSTSTRFFTVNSGVSLTLERITLQNGMMDQWSYGGAIVVVGGSVTLTGCTFTSNSAGSGGAISAMVDSSIIVTDCTFTSNRASSRQGLGGAIMAIGTLSVSGSTFASQTAGIFQNAIDIYFNGDPDKFNFVHPSAPDVPLSAYCVTPITIYESGKSGFDSTECPTSVATTLSSNGDPHLQFADGGSADFRGSHNGIYNMLTSDGISVNALFREQDFFQSVAGIEFVHPGSKQVEKFLVHGTFIFEMYSTVRTSSGRLLHLRTEATPTSAANVAFMENNVPVSELDEHDERIVDDVKITTKDGVTTIETPGWVVLCKIVRTEKSHFLNLSFRSLTNDAPHGIIGQSYDHDGIAVDGAKDVYNSVSGGETTTTAQAEGAIEGAHSDYLMAFPFATAYKYSRFNNEGAAIRDVRKLAGTKKRNIDRERRKLAFLLQRMAGKDNSVGAE